MATTTIRYFYGDWESLADHYLTEQGWEPLFTDLRGVAGVAEFDPPYVISIREAAQEAEWIYQLLRAYLSPAARAAGDSAFGALFWGERQADDMAVLTGYEDPIFTLFTLRPAAVTTLLAGLADLPWAELRAAAAAITWPAPDQLRHLPDFDSFEGYVLTLKQPLNAAASRRGGLVALC